VDETLQDIHMVPGIQNWTLQSQIFPTSLNKDISLQSYNSADTSEGRYANPNVTLTFLHQTSCQSTRSANTNFITCRNTYFTENPRVQNHLRTNSPTRTRHYSGAGLSNYTVHVFPTKFPTWYLFSTSSYVHTSSDEEKKQTTHVKYPRVSC